jgi:hypothetical protein
MTRVKTITSKKALHHLAGHQLVSMQEAVHMVDNQELVICSNRMMYVNISHGQVLCDDLEANKRKDAITVYRNCPKRYHDLFLEQFSYRVSVRHILKKSKKNDSDEDNDADAVTNNEYCILVPNGMNSILRYPVDFVYAQGMLILHKPWSKDYTLTRILKDVFDNDGQEGGPL